MQTLLDKRTAAHSPSRRTALPTPVAVDILLVLALATLLGATWLLLARPVTVTVDGLTESVRTRRATVAALLGDLGLTLHPVDRVAPAAESRPTSGQSVEVERARTVRLLADGQDVTISTWGATVGDAFTDAGITVDVYDRAQLNGVEVPMSQPLPETAQT